MSDALRSSMVAAGQHAGVAVEVEFEVQVGEGVGVEGGRPGDRDTVRADRRSAFTAIDEAGRRRRTGRREQRVMVSCTSRGPGGGARRWWTTGGERLAVRPVRQTEQGAMPNGNS